ncbi:YbfB/YjiJ family MFS transporter [Halomonas sp. MCCC 1A11062]|uniref:YbfB/YjiJ family MFS transporter n=1 Tax=Halomonas sp. MCCC 1A11062 TaxID=2733485 RepID=UPI001F1F416B|nr:YbfB/YjiJ family MFS transporter [Halomonas sp. MCCC 1A11062]MCE8039730.1 YbfB/YjiJ family MFS transporter [Halomonas sp. MCCC 1A11062]
MKTYRPSHAIDKPLPALHELHPSLAALTLSLASAVALGITRFSYGLLLPPMREDLNWSYTLAGSLNTSNAVGYLAGALIAPLVLRWIGVSRLLTLSTVLAGIFMLLSGTTLVADVLLVLRVCSGVVSSFIFIAGGVLASRISSMHSKRSGLLLGIYYGGTGLGIVLSSLLIPVLLNAAQVYGHAHTWQWTWYGLGLLCFVAAGLMAPLAKAISSSPGSSTQRHQYDLRRFSWALGGYFLFGVGCIGYMTFVVALLKEQQMQPWLITLFYSVLGVAVMASSRLWAGLLSRYKGGQALAILNAVLAGATLLPILAGSVPLAFLSGLVFGGVFMSVVASTTALVRHNLDEQYWSAAISAFTVVFAFGQIIGPLLVGWLADGPGGLEQGLAVSAGALAVGALLAWRQKPLK